VPSTGTGAPQPRRWAPTRPDLTERLIDGPPEVTHSSIFNYPTRLGLFARVGVPIGWLVDGAAILCQSGAVVRAGSFLLGVRPGRMIRICKGGSPFSTSDRPTSLLMTM